jgi:hypothetical protein
VPIFLATRAAARISPDGTMLSWLAPVDGVLNVFVAPADAPGDAVAVTWYRGRGVRIYGWTYAGGWVFLQDVGGDEDFHLFGVDPTRQETRDLTPSSGVRTGIAGVSRQHRGELLVSLNRRDPRFHGLFSLDLASGALDLVEENPGLAGFVTDEAYRAALALKLTPNGARQVLIVGVQDREGLLLVLRVGGLFRQRAVLWPVIVLVRDHDFAGFWLTRYDFATSVADDAPGGSGHGVHFTVCRPQKRLPPVP